ncbi:hypothetical protein SAMN04515667_1405 [Formosa sp. Hel1_31_208]|uniref:DUF192 domain-containing protein n=1 Tax=Formosa sp. Hel1_31_208 TaxID=1798225 RepID=UPI0008796470|nr:DUF192 domain-containing protein [Formosa sp. Hel1_31_208]SDS09992.1 hypothetical protein SAMN04515667_1405 [Formosa sp. Hel1_31_208]
MKRCLYMRLALVFFGSLALLNFSCNDQKKPKAVKQIIVTFKKEGELQLIKAANDSVVVSLDIEIADDDYQTQTGLMYRKSMAHHQGMLFIFPDVDYRSFYMKNTEIPLDIIYISETKTIVSIQKHAQPMDETSLPSEGPAKYVLEVNAGLSDEWNLEKGDRIAFSIL